MSTRAAPALTIRPIRAEDDAAIAAIIRTVMPEFGATGPGFAINDPEVDHMSRAYGRAGAAYFVACDPASGAAVGGGGVAPLEHGEADVCELRKMYLLASARGRGTGAQMLATCLAAARQLGYRRCYLETLSGMDAAQKLYARAGFRRIDAAMGKTGHFGCNRFYLLELQAAQDP